MQRMEKCGTEGVFMLRVSGSRHKLWSSRWWSIWAGQQNSVTKNCDILYTVHTGISWYLLLFIWSFLRIEFVSSPCWHSYVTYAVTRYGVLYIPVGHLEWIWWKLWWGCGMLKTVELHFCTAFEQEFWLYPEPLFSDCLYQLPRFYRLLQCRSDLA